MNFLLKIFKVKKRNEIRRGKLWEITRVWGLDVYKVERRPPEPEPLVRKGGEFMVDQLRVHHIKDQNDVTNLTKRTDLI